MNKNGYRRFAIRRVLCHEDNSYWSLVYEPGAAYAYRIQHKDMYAKVLKTTHLFTAAQKQDAYSIFNEAFLNAACVEEKTQVIPTSKLRYDPCAVPDGQYHYPLMYYHVMSDSVYALEQRGNNCFYRMIFNKYTQQWRMKKRYNSVGVANHEFLNRMNELEAIPMPWSQDTRAIAEHVRNALSEYYATFITARYSGAYGDQNVFETPEYQRYLRMSQFIDALIPPSRNYAST